MNKRTLRILEFYKITETVSSYAASPMAKKRCLGMKPRRNAAEIAALQKETRDALLRMNRNGSISFAGVRDLTASIRLLEIQSSLSATELLNISALLETADSVKKYGGDSDSQEDEIVTDSLSARFEDLRPLEYLSGEIKRCILSEDEIADDATSHLKSIRREIQKTNGEIHRQLDKMIKSGENQTYLQDSLVTMRNGRYCIPVKQEYRSRIAGMIHDQSQSGSTLFIEPMAVVNLNNKIKELDNEEHMEIEKILADLSHMASEAVEDISVNLKTLTDLDFIFAKAKYAADCRGTEPIFNTDGIIDIKQGRHPLLDPHTVVPIDIKLGDDYDLLIITGPNTGGKTVALKTLGLFTLMGQAGLHIPAMEGSSLSVFQDVFADIGDEQSIEQNLSTFSSHMSNIIYIVNHASAESLCLFDEPGGGTDPVEGAALAISILSYLKDLGAKCMATTHYPELKTFALSEEGVENASCEFDVSTLQPTYRLMLGIPGKSNAFAISKRLGLPEPIITSARERIDKNTVDMEALIAGLEAEKKSVEQSRTEIETYKADIETMKRRLSEKEAALTEKKEDILRDAREEARLILDEAKETADAAIRDYNKWRTNPNKADPKEMEEKRTALRNRMKSYEDTNHTKKQPKTSGHKAADFHIGDAVEVISMNTKGTIAELPDSKGTALVQMGILSVRLPISDLIIVPEETVLLSGQGIGRQKKNSSTIQAGAGDMGKSYTFTPKINLLGKTVEEAVAELDKFLDDAVLSHASSVTIIHGKGTGALRKGVHEYLKHQKVVRSFRSGEFGEGDAGVTIVEL